MNTSAFTSIRARDYVRANGQLYFAVISDETESGRVLCWLRYIKKNGRMYKLNTAEAADYITEHCATFLFHSQRMDNHVHGVPAANIDTVYPALTATAKLLQLKEPDSKQEDAIHIIQYLISHGIDRNRIGLTGSILLDAHHTDSDIDLIVYGREAFMQAREVFKLGCNSGELQRLRPEDWHEAYQRRDCSLDLETYCWHEQRKFNKCISGHSKVDISMLPEKKREIEREPGYRKIGRQVITARVLDDSHVFDYPASYIIDHKQIAEVVVYTATFTGQAFINELIEASGVLEQDIDGCTRLVIGTSREARGEYLKVIQSEQQQPEETNGT